MNSQVCTICGSKDIAGCEADMDFIYPYIRLPAHCENCGFKWIEIYSFEKMEIPLKQNIDKERKDKTP